MNSDETKVRDMIAGASPDGYIDSEEEREIMVEASKGGLGRKFDSIMTEECIKYHIVREKTAKGQLNSYLQKNCGAGKLSKKQVGAASRYAHTLVPEGNENPDEAWAQLKELVFDPALKGRIKKSGAPIIIAIVIAVIAIGSGLFFRMNNKEVVGKVIVKEKRVVVSPKIKELSQAEQEKIDNLIASMQSHIEQGLYTDPPENCAKTDLDAIRVVDPAFSYRKAGIESEVSRIVDRYIDLAKKDHARGKLERTKKWIARAKLFHRESEVIRDYEREIGLVKEH